MKTLTIIKIILFLNFFSLVLDTGAVESPDIVVENVYGDSKYYHLVTAVTKKHDGLGILVAGSQTLSGAKGEKPSFFLWEFDGLGKLISTINLDFLPIDGKFHSDVPYIKSILQLNDGFIYLIYVSQKGRPYFIKFKDKAERPYIKEIEVNSSDIDLRKMIIHQENKLLILGRSVGDAFLLQVKNDGNILWKKKYDRGKIETFVDGYVDLEGNFILLGNSSEYQVSNFYPSSSEIFFMQIASTGTVINEKSYSGRYGDIVHDNSGIAVVFDKSDDESQKVTFMKVNDDFEKLQEKSIFSSKLGFTRSFYILISGNGFWIVGEAGRDMLVAKYDKDGNAIRSYVGRGTSNSRRIKGAVSDQLGVTLITRIYSEDEQRKINYKVGFLRFKE